MAQEELQEGKLTKAGGRKPTHGCNYPMVGWPSVILTPMGPSLNLTREGTSRPSLRNSLSLSLWGFMVSGLDVRYCTASSTICKVSPSRAAYAVHDTSGHTGFPSNINQGQQVPVVARQLAVSPSRDEGQWSIDRQMLGD